MPSPLQSIYPNILPFLSGIPLSYWAPVPNGAILLSKKPWWTVAEIDTEYLYLLACVPDPGTVSYTGDSIYAQFSEIAIGSQYKWQCVALAKAISGKRNTPTDKWLPGVTLSEFCATPESMLPSSYVGLMIAYFDGKSNYALAAADKKHVAILLDITRDTQGKPKSITVVDQNYYCYPPFEKYAGKIAKHTMLWGTAVQKWVAIARSYRIVNV